MGAFSSFFFEGQFFSLFPEMYFLFGRKQGKKLTFGKKTRKGAPRKLRALESSFISYKKINYPIKIGVGMLETEMSLLILA